MSYINPNNPPPSGFGIPLFQWIVQNILAIKRRLNGISGSGGGGGGVSTNIYTNDGSLLGNRTVDGAGYSLGFTNTSTFTARSTNYLVFYADNSLVLNLDGTDNSYALGDVAIGNNGTFISIMDNSKIVSITNAVATPTMQSYTAGGDITISSGNRGLYYDPATLQAAATITLPATPIDGQEILILFGGQITGVTQAVVTTLTISPNAGQNIVGSKPNAATTDTYVAFKWRSSSNMWYRID